MTADEIRKLPVSSDLDMTNEILKEIALQLADLNEQLEGLSRVGPDGKGANLTVEVHQP